MKEWVKINKKSTLLQKANAFQDHNSTLLNIITLTEGVWSLFLRSTRLIL